MSQIEWYIYKETHSDYTHLHSAKDFVACCVTPLERCIREMVFEGSEVVLA